MRQRRIGGKYMVYVLSKNGKPLCRLRRGKAGRLLEDNRAKAAKLEPSAIQLLYESKEYTQPIALGVDAGSKTIGISATAGKEELYAAEAELRADFAFGEKSFQALKAQLNSAPSQGAIGKPAIGSLASTIASGRNISAGWLHRSSIKFRPALRLCCRKLKPLTGRASIPAEKKRRGAQRRIPLPPNGI
jgi:hypothetical protein